MLSLSHAVRAFAGALLLFATLAGADTIKYSITDLGTLGGTETYARAINDLGVVVGESDIEAHSARRHAFLWTSGSGIQDLGTLGGIHSYAYGINDSGQVVGVSRKPKGASRAAFL